MKKTYYELWAELYPPPQIHVSLVAQMAKNLPAMKET